MKVLKWIAMPVLFAVLFFTACKKDNLTLGFEDSEQMVASQDQTTAQDLFTDIEDQEDLAIETRGAGPDPCPVVSVDPNDGSYPRTITIDFGDGCEGPNGRVRQGKIIITVSDTITNPGATRTTTFENYFVDGVQVEGVKTLTNLGYDDNGNVAFNRTVTGGKLTFPNGEVATWESNFTFTQIEGGNTKTFLDNVFEVTGGSSGVNRHGKSFSSEILEPLIRKKTCPWYVDGVVSLTIEDKTVTIDYGNGTCDNKAILTAPDGSKHVINIKKWW